ncbi:trichohyalin-like [Lucilia sericata]|uniref:trichohyalin-like n=1 Tax=Lucilia sericata TaxID=13632 RepID=UPI0018A8528C|nr:trichohyalin-like [Lucilia sericata]
MGFSYQVKSVKKKSIILDKQENLEIQQNSSRYRQSKRTITKERVYGLKGEQGKAREQQNSKSNVDLFRHKESKGLHNSESKLEVSGESNGAAKKLLETLHSGKQQQEDVIEKVLDTSQQLYHLEATINHEIKKLKQQRRLLKGDSFSMDEKSNKRKGNEARKTSTWADYLGDNNSKERQRNPEEIAKEKYSLQHQCVCTSPRYGSDKNLSLRPRMRSVASQIHTQEEFLDQGAVGDYSSNANLKPFKDQEVSNWKGIAKCSDTQIPKANDQIVNCCYGLVYPAACQQTLKTSTDTNGQRCRHYSCQQNEVNGNRAYTYCRDEYYYNLPNYSFNEASTTGANPQQYRRHNTDLNTQEFYCRRPDKSSKSRSNSKTNKKSKLGKSKESLDDYNANKKRACREKREKQQRSKSVEQRLRKNGKLAQLLSEESVTKLIKYLDRYVDDYQKEFEFENNKETKTKEDSEESSTVPTLKIKSHTNLCQVTVRKKLEQNKHPANLTDCGDSNSLETQYSWETLRMLKKMTIREYKPPLKVKEQREPTEAKHDKEVDTKKLQKAQRYREYLDKFERELQAKKSIQVLKPPPENFPEPDSEEVEIFKQLKKDQTEPKRSPIDTSDQWELLGETNINSSLINKANFSFDQGATNHFPESDSYEELRYEYGAAARGEDSWLDYNKSKDQVEQAKYDQDLKETKGDINYQDNCQEREGRSRRREGRETRLRDHQAEDQRSQKTAKQKDCWNYRKSRDRERRDEDPSARSAEILVRDFKERVAEDQRAQRAHKPKDCWTYRKSRDKESRDQDLTARSSAIRDTVFKEREAEDHSSKIEDKPKDFCSTYRKSRERARKAEYQEVKSSAIPYTDFKERETEDQRYEKDNCLSYRKSIERERRAEDPRTGEAALIPDTDFQILKTNCFAKDFDFYRNSKDRERRNEDQIPRYVRERRKDLKEELKEGIKVEDVYNEETFRPSTESPRITTQQTSRYNDQTRRTSKEAKPQPSEYLSRTALERVQIEPECRERRQRRSQDLSSKNFKDKRMESTESIKHFLEHLNKKSFRENNAKPLRESQSKEAEDEVLRSRKVELNERNQSLEYDDEIFEELRAKPGKSKDQNSRRYCEDKRREFEDQCSRYYEVSKRDYRGDRQAEDNEEILSDLREIPRKAEDENSKYRRDSRDQSCKYYEDPHRRDYAEYDAEDFDESTAKPRKAKDHGRNDFKDKRRVSEDQNNDLNDYKERKRDFLEVKQYPKERDLRASEIEAKYGVENPKERQRIAKDQIDTPNGRDYKAEQRDLPEVELIKEKIEKHDELDEEELHKHQHLDLEDIANKPKTSKRSKRVSENNTDDKEPRTTTSLHKEFQLYPLKQEPQMPEEFSNQHEQFSKEPESYVKEDPGKREKNSNSSSYNDFKQVMDHSLGLYTSRASQTDYQFKPQLNAQLSSQTFTREKETPNENQKEYQETLAQSTELPLTTSEALKYLKNFLTTYQDSNLEGQCAEAVTLAAQELITKLSSCKSSLQTETNSRMQLQEPRSSLRDSASFTVEQKLTQDTQFKDLETTTDSSDPQIANAIATGEDSKTLTAESYKSQMEWAVGALKEQAKEDPLIELIEQESYHYKSQPCDMEQWESMETYQRYEEYNDNSANLRSQQEKYVDPRASCNTTILQDNSHYMEMQDPLPLSYGEDCTDPCVQRKFTCGSLPGPNRLHAFDPQLMPLKGILKPCRTIEDAQMVSYDLESHRTTSVVSFGLKEEVNTHTETAMSFKQADDEVAQHCNETQQTIITKDELLQQPITQQTKYQLTKTINTKHPLNQNNQLDASLSASESYYRNTSSRLYTVELAKFKQCPCMLDTYLTMLNNYYKSKKN